MKYLGENVYFWLIILEYPLHDPVACCFAFLTHITHEAGCMAEYAIDITSQDAIERLSNLGFHKTI